MDLIEAMARGICSHEYEDPDYPINSAHHREWFYPSLAGQPLWHAYKDISRAAFNAAEAAGWKMVPVVATGEMVRHGVLTWDHAEDLFQVWSAMLSASPAVEKEK